MRKARDHAPFIAVRCISSGFILLSKSQGADAGLIPLYIDVIERTLGSPTPVFPNRHQGTTAQYHQWLHLPRLLCNARRRCNAQRLEDVEICKERIFKLQDVSASTVPARLKVFADATKLKKSQWIRSILQSKDQHKVEIWWICFVDRCVIVIGLSRLGAHTTIALQRRLPRSTTGCSH